MRLLLLTLAAAWASGCVSAKPGAVSFRSDIAPLLRSKCQSCHGARKAEGKYRVDNFAELMRTLKDEPARVQPGHPDSSLLFEMLVTKDEEELMPQKSEPLSAKEVALFGKWIEEGAVFDGKDPTTSLAQIIPAREHAPAPAKYPRPLPITALAFSPDGKELAASGLREVTVWDSTTGELRRRIPGMAQRTYALAWNPDGGTLTAGGGIPGELGEVRIFDATTGDLMAVTHQAGDVVLDVQHDVNGTLLAVADADNFITVYHTDDLSTRLRIDNHSDWVMAVTFSPNTRFLASASRDRSAKIFEMKTGDTISTYGGHGVPVLGVAFRDDGKQMFSSGRDGKIHVWKTGLADIDGKRFGAEKVSEISGLGSEVYKLVRHDNMIFSVSTDGKARVHQATDRRLLREFVVKDGSDWLQSVAFHSPSGRLATGVHDGTVRVWDAKSGELLQTFTASPH